MLISHRKKFIYTKTFKTASTTVEVYFEPLCLPDGVEPSAGGRDEYVSEQGIVGYRGHNPLGTKKWFNHMPASSIRSGIGSDVWDEYFKFCTIRNPFEKLVSGFSAWEARSRLQSGGERPGDGKAVSYDGLVWPDSVISGDHSVERFRAWIHSGGRSMGRDK